MQIVAVTDPLTLGFRRQAMIGIKCEGDLERVADALADMDEIDYVVITAGSFDLLVEVVCEDDDHLLEILSRVRAVPSVTSTETFVYLNSASRPTPGEPDDITRARPSADERRTPPSATCGCTSPACRPTRTATCR